MNHVLSKAGKIVKALVMDPGFGFAVSNAFIFAATSPIGLWATIVNIALVGAIKTIEVVNPRWYQKDNRFTRILKDEATPLRMLAMCCCLELGGMIATTGISAVAAASGASEFFKAAWKDLLLPAASTILNATGTLLMAGQISRAEDYAEDPTLKRKKIPAYKKPEAYLALNTMMTSTMASVWAFVSFPLLIAGSVISIRNARKGLPGYTGHPKIYQAVSGLVTSVLGVMAGNYHAAASAFMDFPYLTRTESMLTPGGFKRVVSDIRVGCRQWGRKLAGLFDSRYITLPDHVARHMTVQDLPPSPSSLPPANTITPDFQDKASPDTGFVPPVPPTPTAPQAPVL